MNNLKKRCNTRVFAKPSLKFTTTLGLACILTLSGCTLSLPDKRVEYKKTKTLPTLEVPPDLTASRDDELVVPDINPSETANYSDYSKERENQGDVVQIKAGKNDILPTSKDVVLHRDGSTRWLEVKQAPEKVWQKTREFWEEQGFKFKREDKRIGLIETEWNENRGDIPNDVIRKTIGKVLDGIYSASTRDKFIVRLEPSQQAGNTDIYLTHRGMQEVNQGSDFVWEPRPTDKELEAEMLSRLMVFLGLNKNQAKAIVTEAPAQTEAPPAKAKRTKNADGQTIALEVFTDFARSWRRTGMALDRTGFTVEDRNRSEGLYFVRYVPEQIEKDDKRSFTEKLKFWRSDDPIKSQDLQIKVSENGNSSQVTVLGKDGGTINPVIASPLLELLFSQLK